MKEQEYKLGEAVVVLAVVKGVNLTYSGTGYRYTLEPITKEGIGAGGDRFILEESQIDRSATCLK